MTRVTLLLKTNEGGMWVLPQIAQLKRQGMAVTAVLPPGRGKLRNALEGAGVPIEDSPFGFSFRPSISSFCGLMRLRGLIRQIQPDVLFYHLYASALAGRLASIGLSLRRIHMVAGPLYLDSRPIRIVERVLSRLDHQLIAGSEHTANRYRALGFPPKRLSSIPYGVNLSKFTRGDDCREKLFGCRSSTFVAVMVAYVYPPKRLVHQGKGVKGHDVLLYAWEGIQAKHPDALLVLVGGGFGAEGERYRQMLMTEFDVQHNPQVRWFDSVEDVRAIYNSADVSVSPSLSENHGAALEASSMSVPSIVSDAGGLPETVTAASGWIVPAGDPGALETALASAIERHHAGVLEAMGVAARAHVEAEFSVDTCARRLSEVFEAT